MEMLNEKTSFRNGDNDWSGLEKTKSRESP